MKFNPYIRLMRLHQPVGTWLLLWPCLWALFMASKNPPPIDFIILFTLGAICMRAAGCVINDMWDKEFDRQVERTRSRPIASGEISRSQAGLCLLVLLGLAFIIMLKLPVALWYLAIASLIPVAIYPAMKRISWWPQLFLGLAFNWGALMGWAAITGTIDAAAIALYVSGIFWTVGYDTIYAHQDKMDDARIGVRSSALRLGRHSRLAVSVLYTLAIGFLLFAGFLSDQFIGYYISIIVLSVHMAYQVYFVDFDSPASCLATFKSNAWAGILPVLGIVSGWIF